MTLLQLAQEFCKRRGLPQPVSVSSATDDTTLQIWGLLNEGMSDICDRYEWQHLNGRATYTHANGTAYLAFDLTSLPDYRGMLNRTHWDTVGRREVYGPLSPKDREILLNMNISQAVYNYWIQRNSIRVYPVPTVPANNPFVFEYLSSYGILDGGTGQPVGIWSNDNDTSRFPDNIILSDLKWRYNQAKGLAYAEDLRMSEQQLINLQGRDPAPDIVMGEADWDERIAAPGLLIAAGSWNLP